MNKKTINQLLTDYPYVKDFFDQNRLNDISDFTDLTFSEYLDQLTLEQQEDIAINSDTLISELSEFIKQMQMFLNTDEKKVNSLTIIAGQNKQTKPESFKELTINTSEIVSIVGPTGSGKSRLLADIEWVAQQDTPTKRKILINNEIPDLKWRLSTNNKLVAQLSQNMNFVIDMSVKEFLNMHAQSRMVENAEELVNKILNEANKLAGEQFDENTPVTSLSGGQSRALMIADTAILSASPIVLIDEIENAGIDREKALELLVAEDKIVFMATHDPLLALMADKRIIINNGGIVEVLKTSPKEKELLKELTKIDNKIQNIRQLLRYGKSLTTKDF
ncbi:MAG: ATP-binding cassette domain-containing protein [Erysipelotrichaceae bacterium]